MSFTLINFGEMSNIVVILLHSILELCENNQADVIDIIVTGSEIWVHFYDTKSKQEPKHWHIMVSLVSKKSLPIG